MGPCILRNLLAVDPSDNRKLDQDMTRYECFNVILAGVGSTSAGLIAIFYELGLHPEWQERLYLDLHPLFEDGKLPSSSRLSQIASLQAVIKESLRLHPPFSGPFERVIGPGGENTIPNAKPLPLNTRVWSSLYVICHSEEAFGSDANVFRPERWLDESRSKQMQDDTFFAFGRGSRGCIGKDLAWMILELSTAAIIREWKLSCKPGSLKGVDAFEMQYDELEMAFTSRG
ncbi:MAG: hypothetical protein Q9225_003949 [Loekoesia sp. 1 TL-2023]